MEKFLTFVTANQVLIVTLLLCGTYLINKAINALAANPKQDVWDKLRPYSAALSKVVFDGVEFMAKIKPMPAFEKGQLYLAKLEEFDRLWKQNKITAIRQLFAWYEAARTKKAGNLGEITADSVAIE